jgi:formamidopyrimidine-DNA glycosylase
MPELPEVETVARGLRATLEGHIVTSLRINRADLRVPFPQDLVRRVQGRRIVAIGRRAKYLLLTFDSDDVMVVHLGMSGRFVIMRQREGKSPAHGRHDHMVLTADDGVVYVLNDPRRFGRVVLTRADRLATDPLFADLGPEPLDPGFDGKVLAVRLDGKKTTIKAALLDQRVVAGLGNIYVCEALFRARLSPLRSAGTIGGARASRLASAIRAVLTAAIAAGGSSLRDFVGHDGELGYFQHSFSVYDREGQPCPGCNCDVEATGGIERLVQSGRSTFYCPRRQR